MLPTLSIGEVCLKKITIDRKTWMALSKVRSSARSFLPAGGFRTNRILSFLLGESRSCPLSAICVVSYPILFTVDIGAPCFTVGLVG